MAVFLFMSYLTILFAFQFLIIGATFATVIVFLRSITNEVLRKFRFDDKFLNLIYEDALIVKVVYGIYLFIIFISLFMSMSVPIEKAMPYFRCMGLLFSLFSLITIGGIVIYLTESGFISEIMIWDYQIEEYQGTGEYGLNVLALTGSIMLSVFIIPIVSRPIDFLSNAGKYIIGLISYIVLMPMFTNVF